ncbi:MAG TPA: hypothetical protein PK095_01710 [Myxococcota bacterium]|nr:hypothetical protein [Myxococcota bacterium]
MRHPLPAICMTLGLLQACSDRAQPLSLDYRTTDLGAGRCLGINTAGQVVGLDGDQAFVVSPDKTRIALSAPDSEPPVGLAIGPDGSVVGYLQDETHGQVAAVYKDGAWRPLFENPTRWGNALATGPDGEVVGVSAGPTGPTAFALMDGEPITLPLPPGDSAGYLVGHGRVAGIYETEDERTHAFVATVEGTFQGLGTLGGETSAPLGMNRMGIIVGVAETGDGAAHAFMRLADAETLTDLGRPEDSVSSNARGIDDKNRIVGNALFSDGTSRPILFARSTHLDLMPTDENGEPFLSAHIAQVAPNGLVVGWGMPRAGGFRCIVWTPTRTVDP